MSFCWRKRKRRDGTIPASQVLIYLRSHCRLIFCMIRCIWHGRKAIESRNRIGLCRIVIVDILRTRTTGLESSGEWRRLLAVGVAGFLIVEDLTAYTHMTRFYPCESVGIPISAYYYFMTEKVLKSVILFSEIKTFKPCKHGFFPCCIGAEQGFSNIYKKDSANGKMQFLSVQSPCYFVAISVSIHSFVPCCIGVVSSLSPRKNWFSVRAGRGSPSSHFGDHQHQHRIYTQGK